MTDRQIHWQQDLKVFRERMGGVSEAKKEWARRQKETVKAIRAALQRRPMTVPLLAAETGLPAKDVLWYVLALKRYGQIVEGGRQGDYLLYRLKEGSHEPASGSGAGQ
jgi:predicted transcriptional regulator